MEIFFQKSEGFFSFSAEKQQYKDVSTESPEYRKSGKSLRRPDTAADPDL